MFHKWFRGFVPVAVLAALVPGFLLWADEPVAKPERNQTTGEPKTPSPEELIRQALAKRLKVKYDELPLSKVAEDIQAKLGAPVRLDTPTELTGVASQVAIR